MASIHSNASWSLDFEGPALQCSALGADDELRINVTESAAELCWGSGYCYQYMYWMPGSTIDLSPFQPDMNGSTRDDIHGPRDAPISLYVAVKNGQFTYPDFVFDSFTRCILYSASYHSEFNYRSGVQDIKTVTTLNKPNDPWFPTIASMSSFEDITRFRNGVGVPFQAVTNAFSSMLVGSVHIYRGAQGAPQVIQTQVGMTTLAKDLGFFENQTSNQPEGGHEIPTFLEEMFRNITLSLMSQAELNPAEPIQADIETHAYQNIYIYSATALWIAYGVAMGITFLSITIGTWAVAAAGSSYSSKFSTILRLAFNVHLSEYLELRDTGGEDPLPDRLENTIVVFPSRNVKGGEGRGSLLGNNEEGPSEL
ncbi:uncharacterized protein ColSpa_12408 [Colletotrichum spaethianum]|uniref:Uncharacterized protein n=1 Tax=Colletotrichum spaethianum TaxID=700344 RepID=A0AA37PHH1_9PEZI|nr:uncharacterized protein ColSpa_12408 [Colletotrichum spaethianum]GKT52227.1 hypothetical protein ColSpa_12408 [Colletotrichum spaethianum]